MKIVVTHKNYDEIKDRLREFLISEIEGYIKTAGSMRNLSLQLGMEESYVFIKYKRAKQGGGSLNNLERLWKELSEVERIK